MGCLAGGLGKEMEVNHPPGCWARQGRVAHLLWAGQGTLGMGLQCLVATAVCPPAPQPCHALGRPQARCSAGTRCWP